MKTFKLSTLVFVILAVAIAASQKDCGICPNELPPGWNYVACPGTCNNFAGSENKVCEIKLDLHPNCFGNSDDFEKYSNDYVKDWCKCTCDTCGNSTSTFPPQEPDNEKHVLPSISMNEANNNKALQHWLNTRHMLEQRNKTKSGYWSLSRVEGWPQLKSKRWWHLCA